jgi:ABC-2 type transport system permease protein
MSVLTQQQGRTADYSAAEGQSATHSAPFLVQLWTMTWRNLVTIFRTPGSIIPPMVISGFFLFIYEATLGEAANFVPGLGENSYLGFILPLSIVSAALSGAGIAGQNIVRDIENGYFDKLLLTPISRSALLLAPMLAGAVVLVLQTSIIMAIGLLIGLNSVTGVGGILVVLGLALLLGLGFAGFNVAIALRSGNSSVTQSSGFLFFPLTFVTASFVPLDLLEGWLQTAARLNPITYLLDGMRAVLNTGWEVDLVLRGVLACGVLGAVTFVLAYLALRSRTRRK